MVDRGLAWTWGKTCLGRPALKLMTDFIYKLVSAIATQEGRFQTYNMGDLRDCPWFPADSKGHRYYPDTGKAVAYANGFWIPRTRVEGLAGLYHQLALDIAKGWTLKQLLNSYAPPSDGNNTAQYIINVMAWVGITSPDEQLWNYLEVMNFIPAPKPLAVKPIIPT